MIDGRFDDKILSKYYYYVQYYFLKKGDVHYNVADAIHYAVSRYGLYEDRFYANVAYYVM